MIAIAASSDRLSTHRAFALSLYDATLGTNAALRVAIESAETVEEIAGLVTDTDVKAIRRRYKTIEGQLSFDFDREGNINRMTSRALR